MTKKQQNNQETRGRGWGENDFVLDGGRELFALSRGLRRGLGEDGEITELRFKCGVSRGSDVMCIVKATFEGKDWVAFFSGTDLAQCIIGLTRQLREDKIRWKEDKPYGG